jgi:hypothetical protein
MIRTPDFRLAVTARSKCDPAFAEELARRADARQRVHNAPLPPSSDRSGQAFLPGLSGPLHNQRRIIKGAGLSGCSATPILSAASSS